jgi:hypothetical protein
MCLDKIKKLIWLSVITRDFSVKKIRWIFSKALKIIPVDAFSNALSSESINIT